MLVRWHDGGRSGLQLPVTVDNQAARVPVLSTDSVSQVRHKVADAFNVLPHMDASLALYDDANDRLMDVDASSVVDSVRGVCHVNTVAHLRLGPNTPVHVDTNARPLNERAVSAGRRLMHLAKPAATSSRARASASVLQ